MHELSIVESIIEIIEQEMLKNNIKRVETISLKIGEMRQVVPEALLFGFECLTKNTPLENAKINIQNIPIRAKCHICENQFEVKNWLDSCVYCHNNEYEIISGKELEIASFEGS